MNFKICSFFFFILPSLFSSGQKNSAEIDSLTQAYFVKLPRSDQKVFNKIIKNRLGNNFLKRIDTMQFDYVFINESYCSSSNSIEVIERYFAKGDSLSDKIIVNGNRPRGFEKCLSRMDYFRMDTLVNAYDQLKWFQPLSYTKYQIWMHGCAVEENEESDFAKARTKELLHTYQIQIMIDKVHSKIVLSFQTKPDTVVFETIPFDILGHCW